MTYEPHPIAAMFPLLEGADLEALAADIREHGLIHPITLYEGKVLDGRNRLAACEMAGMEARFEEWTGTATEAVWYVWSENINRRHMDPGQRAACLVRRGEYFREQLEAEAKERQAAQGERGAEGGRGKKKTLPQLIGEPGDDRHATETDAVISAFAGVNRETYRQARVIEEKAPERLDDVIAGRATIPQVIRELKRAEVLESLESIEGKQAREKAGVYDVIVIDPPWPMHKIERDVRPNQVAFDYPTMTELELEALIVPANTDCHLWLWTTHRFLPVAFRLLDVWSFAYVCAFVWHKPGGFQPVGLPQYNCEFALYARRGSPKFIDTKALPVCFNAPRGEHSEKPEEFYAMIRRVTAGRRLDMFNRRAIEGFDGWGNEAA